MSTIGSPLTNQLGSTTSTSGDDEADEILVLDAHKNASVVFLRTLAEENVTITAGGWSRVSPGMFSRHVSRTFLYPNPYKYPVQFVTELISHLETRDYLAVIPISDLSHVLLSKNKGRLEETGTAVGTERWERFTTANNKKSIAGLATDLSVPKPSTEAPESLDDIPGMAREFSYPVVIKPQYTTNKTADGAYVEARISEENYVDHPDELASNYRSLIEKYPYLAEDLPIVQEVVSGQIVATAGLAEDGEFIEYFQEERLRMFPVDGGASALRRGIRHPQMAAHAQKIVDELDWTGPIYVEFIDSPEGNCYVLEVNGRYWGSVGCAIRGGVNVPVLHYRQLKGLDSPSDHGYRTGIKQRRLFYTDIRWLLAHLRDGNLGAVAPFFVSFFNADHDLLSRDDPLPAVGAVGWAVQELSRDKTTTDSSKREILNVPAKLFGLLRRLNE